MESAKRKLNILFVSATVPYPAIDGGRIRVLNLVKNLCKISEVTFLTFINSLEDEQGAEQLREMGAEVIGVRRSLSEPLLSLWGLIQSLFTRKPITIAKYYSHNFKKTLRNLVELREFDVIHCEMLHTSQLLPDSGVIQQSKTVLGEQNIDSGIWERLYKTERNPIKKLVFYWQYKCFLRYERRVCSRFGVCLCVSGEDKIRLSLICPKARIDVVPNGVDLDYFKPEDVDENEARLVFTGSMDWQPNEDAVVYFCDHIFPLIRAKMPSAVFYIVGSNPTERVLRLRKIEGVIVTGLVDDVRSYISDASVFVVPLRIGGGTRLKILQALAMRKAVVSTSVGCEGLGLCEGEHILVVDDPQGFASKVIRLLNDRSMRYRLGEAGRILVQKKYGWEAIVGKLESIYKDLII